VTRHSLRVHVDAIAVRGPGLANWDCVRAVLAGHEAYVSAPVVIEPPVALSPAERRRAIPSVRLALAIAVAAVEQSGRDPAALPSVFASSGADGDTIAAILSALATPGREVSPTRFHNSVHNAPSGYWSVAVQSREPATSLSAHDASFAAGLLEAAVQAVSASRPVLLVSYDLPYPHPLDSVRHIGGTFGTALIIAPEASARTFATLELYRAPGDGSAASSCADPGLDALRRGNPAARSLPLLSALAIRSSSGETIRLAHGQGSLVIDVAPC
jgi:hypothetical protein